MPRIILDTDPGIDDALAIFLALTSPEVQLEAITTVNGNVGVDLTTHNALGLLTLAGRTDIPVARGCSHPLVRPPIDAAHVHGPSGLGELMLPVAPIQPVAQHAVELIIEKVLQAPGEITLVAIGPLSNIALAVRREPRITELVREVVIMGGALRVPGNVTPAAEFNIFADPHAAYVVFHAGWPIRLVSLDVTTRVLLQREQINELTHGDSPIKRTVRQMMDFYFDVFLPQIDEQQHFQMHDPLCLAAAFQPDLITWAPAYVDVELSGTLTSGATVASFRRPEHPNVQASVAADAERFIRLFLQRVGGLLA